MLDRRARALYAPAMDRAAERAAHAGITAGAVTGVGLLIGLGACAAAATGTWWAAWSCGCSTARSTGPTAPSRVGRTPRISAACSTSSPTSSSTAASSVGVAIAQPGTRVACAALLAAYLLNNVALLSFASLIEKRGLPLGDERSLRFTSRSPCASWADDPAAWTCEPSWVGRACRFTSVDAHVHAAPKRDPSFHAPRQRPRTPVPPRRVLGA